MCAGGKREVCRWEERGVQVRRLGLRVKLGLGVGVRLSVRVRVWVSSRAWVRVRVRFG